MPYLTDRAKKYLEDIVVQLVMVTLEIPGQLNYLFTRICLKFLQDRKESYQTYNEIIGALECCKLEFYRRKVALYESHKIVENGDVYLTNGNG